VGHIEWPRTLPPNPARSFAVLKADYLQQQAFRKALDAEIGRRGQRDVLVFVHGFNNLFEEALYRFAQIAHDSGAPAVPVLFTWPSRGELLQYPYDRESTNYSRDALEQTLDLIAADPNVREITILAHSMGNWLTLESLRQMAIRRGAVGAKIGTVVLASPDVDVDVFRTEMARLGDRRPNLVMFVAQDDEALLASKEFWGGIPRIGAVNPQREPYKTEFARDRIAVFNLTKLPGNGDFNHDKFDIPVVARFIGQQLASGQPLETGAADFSDALKLFADRSIATVGSAASVVVTVPVALAGGTRAVQP
jgi:esterase/lipase superfamily enzyme